MIFMTFLFPDQRTPLMGMADQFDRFVETRIHREMEMWRDGSGGSVWVANTASLVEFLWSIIRAYPDTMRFGSDIDAAMREVARGDLSRLQEHILNDALRALNVIPVGHLLGKGIARVGRLLSIRQAQGTSVCSFVTTVNALRVTGQSLFVSADDLLHASGTTAKFINAAGGTDPAAYRQLQLALQRLGFRVMDHLPVDLQDLTRIVRANRDSVFTFTFRRPGQVHTIYATFNQARQVATFVDALTGETVETVAQFHVRYPGATLNHSFPVTEFPNSALVKGNDFVQLFFPVGRAAFRQISGDARVPSPERLTTSGQTRDDRRHIVMGQR